MSRIEIPMDEYNGMKERIEELEKTIVSKDKEIQNNKEKCLELENKIDDIVSLSVTERLFNWKTAIKTILVNDY